MITILIISGLVLALGGMKFYQYKKRQAPPDTLDAPMENTEGQSPTNVWLKRIGFGGFMFFLIKGLIWLALFFFTGKSFF